MQQPPEGASLRPLSPWAWVSPASPRRASPSLQSHEVVTQRPCLNPLPPSASLQLLTLPNVNQPRVLRQRHVPAPSVCGRLHTQTSEELAALEGPAVRAAECTGPALSTEEARAARFGPGLDGLAGLAGRQELRATSGPGDLLVRLGCLAEPAHWRVALRTCTIRSVNTRAELGGTCGRRRRARRVALGDSQA